MSKGEQTRTLIVQRAAEVFSRQGYFGTSLADIMQATGLEKGGIYNHFSGKEQIALAAFDYAFELLSERIRTLAADSSNAVDRLQAFVAAFASQVENPIFTGGCYVMNTAIEADDAHPALRERAHTAIQRWLTLLHGMVADGIARGEIRPEVDPDTVATMLVAALEGAVMLSKITGNREQMRRVAAHLSAYLEQTVRR
jgi:AcrR family transcriptional regulator